MNERSIFKMNVLMIICVCILLACIIVYVDPMDSILGQEKTVKVTFSYEGHEADSVFVAGNFNGWQADIKMEKSDGGEWIASVHLLPGDYHSKFVVDGAWIPDPENQMRVNDGGDSYNSMLKVGEPPRPKRKIGKLGPLPRDTLPKPVLDGNPEWVNLYYVAWRMAWEKISFGTPQNGFVERYMDEGFNELIFQWDTVFMTMFGMYARHLFPVLPSLDNFYRKQRADGYIQQVYSEAKGEEIGVPTSEEPMVNPPLFAWAELRYAR